MRRWSSLIAPCLVGACAGTPPQEPAPLPPQPLPPVASASAPPPPPAKAPRDPRVGPLVVVAKVTGGANDVRAISHFAHTRGFAVATADFLQPWMGPCAFGSTSCTLLSIAKRPSTTRFDAVPDDLEPMGPAVAAPQRWSELSAGRDAIFGTRDQPTHTVVDRIDATGKVSQFLEIEGLQVVRAHVVQLATKLLLLAEPDVRPRGIELFELEVKGDKATVKGEPTHVAYATAQPRFPGGPVGAQRAREVEDMEGAGPDQERSSALWGPYRAFPLLDDAGAETDGWALVAVQVNPPPPEWPEGRVFHKKKGKAKHDCGGKSSRALSDKSVEKVLRVLRFQGTKLVSDRPIKTSSTYDHEKSPLLAVPKPGGAIEIDGVLHGPDDKRAKGAGGKKPAAPRTPEVPGLPFAPVPSGGDASSIVFDARAGEGLFVFHDGETRQLVRFDAAGKPKGATEPAEGHGEPVRLGDAWAAVMPRRVTWLTGPKKGKAVEQKLGFDTVGWVADGERVTFFRQGTDGGMATHVFDAATDEHRDAGAIPGLVAVKAAHRWAMLVEGKPALVEEAGATVRLVKTDGAVLPLVDLGDAKVAVLRRVFGDAVLVAQAKKKDGPSRAHWLFAKGTTDVAREETYAAGGIGWPDGGALFDAEPGPLVSHADLGDVSDLGCSIAVATGPRAWVFGCASGVDPTRPGRALGLRSFVY